MYALYRHSTAAAQPWRIAALAFAVVGLPALLFAQTSGAVNPPASSTDIVELSPFVADVSHDAHVSWITSSASAPRGTKEKTSPEIRL